jgi:polysaccharide biosynthesis transport protein
VYRSETVILVEQQKVPEQYVVSNVAANFQERLDSMTQQILSRTRLLQVINQFGLYPKLRGQLTSDELIERMRKDIQIELVQSASRRGELSAFKVAYLSRDPSQAQQVASQLTSLFIGENVKARQQQSEQTTAFLDSQLVEARNSLSEQEAMVKEFKSQYLGELPEQVQSNMQILSGLQVQQQQEMDALGRAKQQGVYLDSLMTQWRSFEAGLKPGGSAVSAPAVEQELARLRAQLVDLSSHYTEQHPDIRKLKDQIEKTERIKQQLEATAAQADASASSAATSPRPTTYSDLQAMSPRMEVESQLKANRLEIENHQRSIEQASKQIEKYQARLNLTPVREQQLAKLTRDYEQSRKNYEQLLAKRDESGMATNLERQQEGAQFRVLDPPNLPQKPYSPDRLKLNLIGLVAGLGLGLVLVVASETMDDRIYGREDLVKIVPAPVLSEIPPLPTAYEQKVQSIGNWFGRVELSLMAILAVAGFTLTYLRG